MKLFACLKRNFYLYLYFVRLKKSPDEIEWP
jgi:hypothetical protein